MVVRLRRRDMVHRFFREDLGEVGIFRWERDFGFRLLCSNGKFHCRCKFGDEQGVWEEAFAITLKDSVDLTIIEGVLEVLFPHIMV